jgi:hypothetical protein
MYFLIDIDLNNKRLIEFDLFGTRLRNNDITIDFIDKTFGLRIFSKNQKTTLASNDSQLKIGPFIRLSFKNNDFYIESDYLGLEPIFYFTLDNIVLVSNSFEILLNYVRSRNFALTLNLSILKLHLMTSQITMQVTSSSTIYDEIKIAPTNSSLVISGTRLIVKRDAFMSELSNYSYEKLVLRGCEHIASLLNELKDEFSSMILSLSGGRDSRAVLAALRYCFGERFDNFVQVRTGTDAHQDIDRYVVDKLANKFNFPVNQEPLRIKREWKGLDANSALLRWAMGSNGIYYNYDCSINYYQDPSLISLRGGQGNAAGDYGSLNDFCSKAKIEANLDPEWVFNHFLEASESSKKCDDWEILDWHYMKWRYRIHYGRSIAQASKWAINFDPLINPYLDVANMKLTRQERYNGRLSTDIIAAFDGECLDIPFSTKGSSIDNEFISESFIYPLGLGKMSRKTMHTSLITQYQYLNLKDIQYSTKTFNDDCIDLMLRKLKESKFIDKLIEMGVDNSYISSLVDCDYDRDFIKGGMNQFSKLYLFSRVCD